MCDPGGQAQPHQYTILRVQNGLSLAACVPVTGRTHQIRVHFASIGHPLAGDDLYGGRRDRIGRQALHCAKQTYTIPAYTPMPDGIVIDWEAPDGSRWKARSRRSLRPFDVDARICIFREKSVKAPAKFCDNACFGAGGVYNKRKIN